MLGALYAYFMRTEHVKFQSWILDIHVMVLLSVANAIMTKSEEGIIRQNCRKKGSYIICKGVYISTDNRRIIICILLYSAMCTLTVNCEPPQTPAYTIINDGFIEGATTTYSCAPDHNLKEGIQKCTNKEKNLFV